MMRPRHHRRRYNHRRKQSTARLPVRPTPATRGRAAGRVGSGATRRVRWWPRAALGWRATAGTASWAAAGVRRRWGSGLGDEINREERGETTAASQGVELGLEELGDDRQATDRWRLPPVADVEDEDDGDGAACPELACFDG